MTFTYNDQNFKISRYPHSENKSLRAWSSADEHLLKYVEEEKLELKNIAIYNDLFGFLSCILDQHKPLNIIGYKSQEKALHINAKENGIKLDKNNLRNPLEALVDPISIAFIKIPKSMDLFKLYLNQLVEQLDDDAKVLCGFMTKYFSPQMLSIASEYFEVVEQSKAWKKSRILVLSKKKAYKAPSIKHTLALDEGQTLEQYYGVFSAKNIDFASQFLIENLTIHEDENTILDLASGNGVLALVAKNKKEDSEIHLLDDSILAIESSKINLSTKENVHYHYDDTLNHFEDDFFDLVISNPPFHFENENNIEVALELFKGVYKSLKKGGRFTMVSSYHLNFKTHLEKLFPQTKIVCSNQKFVIYDCFK